MTYILVSELYIEDVAFPTGIPVRSQVAFAGDPNPDDPVTLVGVERDQRMHPPRHGQARRRSSTANTERIAGERQFFT
jgi:hypothetical protein